MRFMIIRKADAETEAGVMPTTELIEAMMDYNERQVKAGVMLDGKGLHPSSRGAKVKFNNGKPTVIDGPFAEAKELVAGFSIIEVSSKAEAIEWVKQWPVQDGHGNVEIEIRQIIADDEFGEAFTPELRDKNEGLRKLEEQNR